jgi:glutamate 5-kinase
MKESDRLIVIKVGTSSLMESGGSGNAERVRLANVARLVELISTLKRNGDRVILVSSGAVGIGCVKLGIPKPKDMRTKQAVAAAGQSHLMRMYEDLFDSLGVKVAQLLLSRTDFLDRVRWGNCKGTLKACMDLGLVPIINENDSTNTEELRFGDNDNLASLCAVQIEADWLFLMTDVDYVYTANPNTDPTAKPLKFVRHPSDLQVSTDGGSTYGTGGMETKLVAARTAVAAGIHCGLLHGAYPERIQSFLVPDLSEGVAEGTYFQAMPASQTMCDQRRWILSLPFQGELTLDDEAVNAVQNEGHLLAIGIKKVNTPSGFLSGDCIRLLQEDGKEIARATCNFSSDEVQQIQGLQNDAIVKVIDVDGEPEVCFCGNIVITEPESEPSTVCSSSYGGSEPDSPDPDSEA